MGVHDAVQNENLQFSVQPCQAVIPRGAVPIVACCLFLIVTSKWTATRTIDGAAPINCILAYLVVHGQRRQLLIVDQKMIRNQMDHLTETSQHWSINI